jgi:hypothetical protein
MLLILSSSLVNIVYRNVLLPKLALAFLSKYPQILKALLELQDVDIIILICLAS